MSIRLSAIGDADGALFATQRHVIGRKTRRSSRCNGLSHATWSPTTTVSSQCELMAAVDLCLRGHAATVSASNEKEQAGEAYSARVNRSRRGIVIDGRGGSLKVDPSARRRRSRLGAAGSSLPASMHATRTLVYSTLPVSCDWNQTSARALEPRVLRQQAGAEDALRWTLRASLLVRHGSGQLACPLAHILSLRALALVPPASQRQCPLSLAACFKSLLAPVCPCSFAAPPTHVDAPRH